MILYDSKDQVKKRLTDKRITIYNCGPTVYNHVHIGNVRPLITLDILFRYLKAMNIDVKYALNLTDVDDKIINRAEAEGTTETNISKKYTKAYFDLFKKLNIIKQDYNPKVTTNIKGIISYINKLVKKHKAYIGKNGDVYFDINSVKKTYGELSKQKLNELLHNVRKDIDEEQKKNPLDFVL
jgi:cysteinyl-tRNA synthetase